ncbi:MAG: hypothetical protein HY074_11260 [Deltaproteobacteria bacterium]|nr:hypothetical protein [Deltaproteobacteria bacterium]
MMTKMMIRLAATAAFLFLALTAQGTEKAAATETQATTLLAAIRAHPKSVPSRLSYAVYLEKHAKYEEALDQYNRILELTTPTAALKVHRQTLKTACKMHAMESWIRGPHPKSQDPATEPAPNINGPDISTAMHNAGITEPMLVHVAGLVIQRRVARIENLRAFEKAKELKEGSEGMLVDLSTDMSDKHRIAVFISENGDRRTLIDLLAAADASDSRLLTEFFINSIIVLSAQGR